MTTEYTGNIDIEETSMSMNIEETSMSMNIEETSMSMTGNLNAANDLKSSS